MEKINLSEPDGTRQRWVDGAIRESAALGRAVSISEFVRRAVEAYSEQEACTGASLAASARRVVPLSGKGAAQVGHREPASSVGGQVYGRDPSAPREVEPWVGDERQPIDSGGAVKREAKAPKQRESDPAAPPLRSFPKERQTGKKVKP